MSSNKLIVKNAGMLYLRMFISMAIGFYTSRIVLQALGVSDYGIYNLVGGIVVLANMLTSSLSGATSRYITYSLGEHDFEKTQRTFSTALNIHIGLSILFILVAETVGLWFVNTQLVISPDRMVAANWVYQSAIISTALSITQVPYNSLITSHERFGVFAVIEVLSACLKLVIAFVTLYSMLDHLVLYSILYMVISVCIIVYYRTYCVRNFSESRFIRILDRKLLPQLLKFSGWTLLGNVSLTVLQQGANIIINLFFGTIINAAVGIATQVQGLLYSFIGNITTAFTPQIIKVYVESDFKRLNYLISVGAKFSSICILLISIPIIIKMDFLMGLWLKEVPIGAVVICQILLIKNFFNSFNPLLYSAITATGNIKKTNIFCGLEYLLSVAITYFIVFWTHSYVYAFIFNLITSLIACGIYLWALKHEIESFSVYDYIVYTVLAVTLLGCITIGIALFIESFIQSNLLSFIAISLVSTALITILSFYFVLDSNSRSFVVSRVNSYLHNGRK
ncbi:oligosaccharide flippase family protein [Prevotella fusca]|uniref:oligosaccharide flippase family protein n=1 Tax=Prevotella fusca TaxID=589436 RepID=UPI003FA04F7F